jgi:hypothetical protein
MALSDRYFHKSGSERFVAEQMRRALQKRIESLLGKPVSFRLNANRRIYFSVRFPKGEAPRLSLHRCFAEASDEVLGAVVTMMRTKDARSEEICRRYVAEYDKAAGAHPRPLPAGRLRAKGRFHDLRALAEAVNGRYFGGEMKVRITWGKRADAIARRRSIQFGCYDRALDVTRIHPLLDSPDTPAFYLDYLIYHELLHKALGEGRSEATGRRQIHHAEFRRREREHEHYEKAQAWEREFFRRLSSRRRSPPTAPTLPPSQPVRRKKGLTERLSALIQTLLFDEKEQTVDRTGG